ncbi:hypothetical protein H4582DRAFT_1881898 [Lactarius indigo]|nr:hypothetical protein H4582DRAFT_1881898 [Lactarius indigo]
MAFTICIPFHHCYIPRTLYSRAAQLGATMRQHRYSNTAETTVREKRQEVDACTQLVKWTTVLAAGRLVGEARRANH